VKLRVLGPCKQQKIPRSSKYTCQRALIEGMLCVAAAFEPTQKHATRPVISRKDALLENFMLNTPALIRSAFWAASVELILN
jgi:hypothetical protein